MDGAASPGHSRLPGIGERVLQCRSQRSGTARIQAPSAQPSVPAPSAQPSPAAQRPESPHGTMERPQSDSMRQDLSEAMKEATKEVHTQAENAEFMKNFQKGQVTPRGFKLVMASLYHIYEALEEEIERNKENPVFKPLYFPEELHRVASLQRTLTFWYGPRWQDALAPTPATRRYVRRLHEVGRQEPELLVAHAYTRYLGDLSGGQTLKKIAQKALDLSADSDGLAFFTFPNIDSATKFKQLYRARMNTLDMSPDVRRRVLDEAKTAFLLNIQVFDDLQELQSQDSEDQGPAQALGLRRRAGNGVPGSAPSQIPKGKSPLSLSQTPLVRWVLTLGFLVATVAAVGLYAM